MEDPAVSRNCMDLESDGGLAGDAYAMLGQFGIQLQEPEVEQHMVASLCDHWFKCQAASERVLKRLASVSVVDTLMLVTAREVAERTEVEAQRPKELALEDAPPPGRTSVGRFPTRLRRVLAVTIDPTARAKAEDVERNRWLLRLMAYV